MLFSALLVSLFVAAVPPSALYMSWPSFAMTSLSAWSLSSAALSKAACAILIGSAALSRLSLIRSLFRVGEVRARRNRVVQSGAGLVGGVELRLGGGSLRRKRRNGSLERPGSTLQRRHLVAPARIGVDPVLRDRPPQPRRRPVATGTCPCRHRSRRPRRSAPLEGRRSPSGRRQPQPGSTGRTCRSCRRPSSTPSFVPLPEPSSPAPRCGRRPRPEAYRLPRR